MTQKKLLLLTTSLLLTQSVFAAQHTTIISQTDSVVPVVLSNNTVKCSIKGYGSEELKVLVPALTELTIMDHRNPGEEAPCITAGPCTPDLNPSKILDPSKPTENIPVRVTLTKLAFLEEKSNKCTVYLTEKVISQIRGVNFSHQRSMEIGERNPKDCR